MASLKAIRDSEPVRVWVYPLILSALGIAFKEGYVDSNTLSLFEFALMALFGVVGVEGVRGRVTPVRPAQHELVNDRVFSTTTGDHIDYRGH